MSEIEQSDIVTALEAALDRDGEVLVAAQGNSMGRRLERSRGMLVRRVAPGDALPFGALAVFRRGARWIVHRVIWRTTAKGETVYVTKGDAARHWDSPFVRECDVRGIVIAVETQNGRVDVHSPMQRVAARLKAGRGLAGAVAAHCLRPSRSKDSR